MSVNDLKRYVDAIFNKLNAIEKPKAFNVGEPVLFNHRDDDLRMLTSYTHHDSGHGWTTYYDKCYVVKIGGAYDRMLYKDELNALKLVAGKRLIAEYGTAYSVYGIDLRETKK